MSKPNKAYLAEQVESRLALAEKKICDLVDLLGELNVLFAYMCDENESLKALVQNLGLIKAHVAMKKAVMNDVLDNVFDPLKE